MRGRKTLLQIAGEPPVAPVILVLRVRRAKFGVVPLACGVLNFLAPLSKGQTAPSPTMGAGGERLIGQNLNPKFVS